MSSIRRTKRYQEVLDEVMEYRHKTGCFSAYEYLSSRGWLEDETYLKWRSLDSLLRLCDGERHN